MIDSSEHTTQTNKNGLKVEASPALRLNAVLELRLGRIRLDVVHRRLRDVAQCLLREEGLVARDDHVREREQPSQRVVRDQFARVVRVEELALALKHVQAHAANLLVLQSLHQRASVDETTATRVDDEDAWLHLVDAVFVHDVAGRWKQRTVQRDDVRLSPDLVERHVRDAVAEGLRVLRHVIRQHLAAEARADASKERADLARADDTNRLAVHVETQQSGETEVELARAVVRAVDVAVERHHERSSVLGDGVRRVGRDSQHWHVQLLGDVEIDHVKACAAQEEHASTACVQLTQRVGVRRVVDEDHDGLVARCEWSCLGVEAVGEVRELVVGRDAVALGRRVHGHVVVAVRGEERDLHDDGGGGGWLLGEAEEDWEMGLITCKHGRQIMTTATCSTVDGRVRASDRDELQLLLERQRTHPTVDGQPTAARIGNAALWIGDAHAAKDEAFLRTNDITHVLSLGTGRITPEGYNVLTIDVLDMEDKLLLLHLDQCLAFLRTALNDEHGAALVHCVYGQSRSASVCVAFLMASQNLPMLAAFNAVQTARPCIYINPGFLRQLQLFQRMESDGSLLGRTNAHAEFRALLAGRERLGSGTVELLDVPLIPGPGYSCSKCNCFFAAEANEIHSVKSRSSSHPCTNVFLEPLKWMQPNAHGFGYEKEGKLSCPKCAAKIGSWTWIGTKCQCGEFVSPAFQLVPSRIRHRR